MGKYENDTSLKGYSLVEHNDMFVRLDNKLISIIDSNTKSIIANINIFKYPMFIKFSPDDKMMAVKTTNGSIGLFSLQDLPSLNRVIKYNREGPDMVFTKDSKYILDGDWDGNIRIINTENGEINLIKPNIECAIHKFIYNPDNNEFILFVFVRKDETKFNCLKGSYVLKLDISNNQYCVNKGLRILNHTVDAIYCSSLKNIIAIDMSYVYFIDSTSFNIIKKVCAGLLLNFIKISKFEKYILIASMNNIYLFETKNFRKIKTYIELKHIISIEFSLDESQIYVGTSEGIKILDIKING